MACHGGILGILTGHAKLTDHPSRCPAYLSIDTLLRSMAGLAYVVYGMY